MFCSRACSAAARSLGANTELLGGYTNKKTGYVIIRVNHRPVMKHRAVVERHLGRKLTSDEHVHHMNGIRDDNRLENLAVVSKHDHPTQALKLIQEQQRRIRQLEEQLHG